MKISPKCPACLLNRACLEAEMVTKDKEVIYKAVEEALKIVAKRYPEKGINAIIATEMHRKVYEIIGCEDPYKSVKEKANEVVLKFLPDIISYLGELNSEMFGKSETSKNSVDDNENNKNKGLENFRNLVIASIIGNTFDYGVMGHDVEDRDFMRFFKDAFSKNLKIDDTKEIYDLCRGYVVYLTDNAGEIILDALLMKEIKNICKRLTVVVRGKPILSDATLEDAKLAGVDKIADELLTNGKGAIGIIFEELPDITLKRINEADVIIAKGMANYECLSDSNLENIAFMLTAKCKPIAEDLGVDVGDMVAKLKN